MLVVDSVDKSVDKGVDKSDDKSDDKSVGSLEFRAGELMQPITI